MSYGKSSSSTGLFCFFIFKSMSGLQVSQVPENTSLLEFPNSVCSVYTITEGATNCSLVATLTAHARQAFLSKSEHFKQESCERPIPKQPSGWMFRQDMGSCSSCNNLSLFCRMVPQQITKLLKGCMGFLPFWVWWPNSLVLELASLLKMKSAQTSPFLKEFFRVQSKLFQG